MPEGDQLPAEPPKYEDIVLDDKQLLEAARRYPDDSPAAAQHKMKLSVLAKLKHQYRDASGRPLFGGAQPGSGRKPTKKLGAAIVEAAEERQKEIIDAMFAPIPSDSGADPWQRHRAAMNFAEHARREAQEQRDADEFAKRTDDDIRREFVKILAEEVRAGRISIEDIVEGTATEIPPDQRQLTA